MEKLIDKLELPAGLRNLATRELKQVVQELRDELIETVGSSGGHFASSLGAAEISVVLHHLFDTPRDRLVWDVGHQGYIHKMLTGRRKEMARIRKKDGISGYLKRSESDFDCFGAGHAGTSISAAVGMASALERDDPARHVVAVIGDGALTCGMAFEALNHAGELGLKNLIVVLNDNEMSISPNVGAISWLFSQTVTSKTSTGARAKFKELHQRGYIPNFVYNAIDRAEEMTQGFFSNPALLFEAFGFRYIGPVDGHSVDQLIKAITNAKQQDVPVLVHARTTKGKGYTPAEDDPIKWHAVSPFLKGSKNGSTAKPAAPPPTYSTVFAQSLIKLRESDPRIIAITAAMSTGTGLDKFQAAYPESFFDVGICEQHAVTFAAGLACEGKRPVCAIYSTFLQRAYDQLVHDVCIQNLPVVFAMDRSGAVGDDGETHQGVFDISYLRSIPNIVLMSPKDENELQHMVATGVALEGPSAIRYPRGAGFGVALDETPKPLPVGKAEVLRRGSDALIICYGPLTQVGLQVASRLDLDGVSSTVINARFAKPLDWELLSKELPSYPVVCCLEDHALIGGIGSAILELVNEAGIPLQSEFQRFGIGDSFVAPATQSEQHAENGYDAESVYGYISKNAPRKRIALA